MTVRAPHSRSRSTARSWNASAKPESAA